MSEKALEAQVGGNHYKDLNIQPVEYILANGLGFLEGNVVKYITRHKAKNGIEDVKKAKHYCEMLIEQYEKEQLSKLGKDIELKNTIPQQVIDLEKEAIYFRYLPVGRMFFVDDENGISRKVRVTDVDEDVFLCNECDFNNTPHCSNLTKRPHCSVVYSDRSSDVHFKFVKEQ